MSSPVEAKKRASRSSATSSRDLHRTQNLYEKLRAEREKTRPDLKKCGDLLEELKVGLVKIRFLPVSNSKASRQELLFARNVLETGTLHSISVKDLNSFERYVAQLKCYYSDYKNRMPESTLKYQILGLNLLFLLCQNRIADFHAELELLPSEEILGNAFVRYPVATEQYLTEGGYNKIFKSKMKLPSKYYGVFVDILLETVRGDVADCLETAYAKMSVKEAAKKLHLDGEESALHYGSVTRGWRLDRDHFYFSKEEKRSKEDAESIDLAEGVLRYARELETIV